MTRQNLWSVSILLLSLAGSFPAAMAAEDEAPPPKVAIEELAALLPGAPLGPWDEAAKHPVAFVIWPKKEAATEAGAALERVAATYAQVGVGARVLVVNGQAGALPSVTVERKAARKLAALAGREAKRDLRRQKDRPVALVRGTDGTFYSVGALDLEHQAYNLIRGLKEQLDVRFTDLKPFETISITDLDGSPVDLRAYLDAVPTDVVLLDIWGTWCPPCRKSLPHLARLSKAYEGKATLVGVTCEPGESLPERQEALVAFRKIQELPYPLLFGDLWGLRLKVTEFLGYPTMLFLKRAPEGWEIVSQHVGFESGDEAKVEEALKSALGG